MTTAWEGFKAALEFEEVLRKAAGSYAAKSTKQRVEDAKSAMTSMLNELVYDTQTASHEASAQARHALPASLAAFIAAKPEFRHVAADEIASFAPHVCVRSCDRAAA
jgi:hypothetical protein